ncbi:MAG: sulfatase [Candidatus Omnitrophica bacterium]|nr:sulfatase [Candidatus Omnitrophota bacterium]
MTKKNCNILLVAAISSFLLNPSCLRAERVNSSLDSQALVRGSKKLLNQSKNLLKKAKTFDQEKLLESLGDNKLNGFYFRFDQRIQEAIVYPRRKLGPQDLGKSIKLDLSNDLNPFEIENGEMALQQGSSLSIKAGKKTILQNKDDLDIDLRKVNAVAIRLKTQKNNLVHLGWSLGETIAWDDWHFFANAYLIKDNRYHTYLIKIEDRLKGWLKKGEIKKIGLFFPEEDNVELEYIRLLDTQEKYAPGYYGTTYEKIAGEMRSVIYMRTPSKLGYKIKIPQKDIFLSFGTAVYQHEAPIKFTVSLKDKNHIEELFLKVSSDDSRWHDEELDLSNWRGKDIEIIFEVDAESDNVAFLSNPILFSKPSKRFNVIMVLQDALRADHLSSYGYFRKTSPFLDEFAEKGALFENAFSQGGITISSFASFMTSLYSSVTKVWFITDRLDNNFLTLPEIMRSQGFETIGIIENLDAGLLAGLHQGFDYIAMEEDTDSLLNRAYNAIEKSERNLFIYVHLMDPHGPFNPPDGFRHWYEEVLADDIEEERLKNRPELDPPWHKEPTAKARKALYDGEIRHNDSRLQEFAEKLKDSGVLDDTLLIFTADHGEFLGEHDLWTHNFPGFIQVLHVPLIMVYPKHIPGGRRITQNVQLLDLMPTILELAQIPKKDMLLQGDSLVPLIKKKDISYWDRRLNYSDGMMNPHNPCLYEPYYQGSVFLNNFHLMKNLVSKDIPLAKIRIFDFYSDRQEKYNLAEDRSRYLEKYLEADLWLGDFMQRFQQLNAEITQIITQGQEDESVYTQEEIDSLRSLGYLQ